MRDVTTCKKCGDEIPLASRFCPRCGNSMFFDLSREDISDDHFLEVMNSIYSLVITEGIANREKYYNRISRLIIDKRFELEYKLEVKEAMSFHFWDKFNPDLIIKDKYRWYYNAR
jgi:hypothetical protein